jgi:hypothetical protein
MHPQPYYSIVVTSRNDSHGGNIMKRMRLFVNGLIHQANRFQLPIELIFVEWNPPADKPRLHEVLPKPAPEDYLRLRYITVPERIHARYKRAQEIPLFQMTAKNVGIRRALGEYVLCSNVDLLFSDALLEILAQKTLDPKAFYRANRVDIPDGIDEAMPFEAQMAYAQSHIIRVNGWDARFQYVDVRAHGIKELGPISRWITDQMGKRHRSKQPLGEAEYYLLDRNACGDFTMLHRDAWLHIQGYAELDLYSIHIDTLGIVAARALGYQQVVFPSAACTYHIDHPTGWSSMGPIEKLKFLEERPGIDFGVLQEVTYHLLETHKQLNINPTNWGFADEALEEIVF